MTTLGLVINGLAVVAVGVALYFFRLGEWSSKEAVFWRQAAIIVTADPKLGPDYMSLVMWTRAHPPGVWERLVGWRPPEERLYSNTINNNEGAKQ